ncbi:MAG: gliding motility-associated C-terminal domain-containing protein [Bacteroidota bacterium]
MKRYFPSRLATKLYVLGCFLLTLGVTNTHANPIFPKDQNSEVEQLEECTTLSGHTFSHNFFPLSSLTPPTLLCDTIILEDTINISYANCGFDAKVCFPVPFEILNTLEIYDNGVLYNGSLSGCDIDTTIAYTYSNLFGQGSAGPYLLESWTVNGVVFSGQFGDIDALIDSLNMWDSLGGWMIDTTFAFTIVGGVNENVYGTLVASKPGVSGSTAVMGANFGLTPLGSLLTLSAGTHEIVILDNNSGCEDTVILNIACLPNSYLAFDTYLNVSGSICVDTSDLLGNFTTIENVCADTNTTDVVIDIFPNDICIDWETVALGSHEACLSVCDDLGYCDTTFIAFTVYELTTDTIEVPLTEDETATVCIDTSEFLGNINTLISLDNADFASIDIDSQSYCLNVNHLSLGSEIVCYVLCDDQGGCDTTCLHIMIEDDTFSGVPVANNDADTVSMNTTAALNVLDNDLVDTLVSISVVSPPSKGVLTLDSLGNLSYIPDPIFCGIDQFTYEICNALGCDQATVSITVACSTVRVYNGFSPNGDGVNDSFTILGLEGHPNNKLYVYNRWGNLVFRAENYKNDWEGIWNGVRLTQGSYIYVVELNDEANTVRSGMVEIAY